MDQEGLQGVAGAGTLDLRIQGDLLRHVQVRIVIHKEMTDPLVMTDYGNLGVLPDHLHEAIPTAGNDQINEGVLFEEELYRLPFSEGDHLDQVLMASLLL